MEIVSEKRGTLGEEGVRGFSNREKPLEGSEKAYSISVAIKTSGFVLSEGGYPFGEQSVLCWSCPLLEKENSLENLQSLS